MKKLLAAVATAATLALSACGSSENVSEAASPDTVEVPAENALSTTTAEPTEDKAPAASATMPSNKLEDQAAAAAAAAADFKAAGDEGAKPADAPAEAKQ